jgi:hypothetical protein
MPENVSEIPKLQIGDRVRYREIIEKGWDHPRDKFPTFVKARTRWYAQEVDKSGFVIGARIVYEGKIVQEEEVGDYGQVFSTWVEFQRQKQIPVVSVTLGLWRNHDVVPLRGIIRVVRDGKILWEKMES